MEHEITVRDPEIIATVVIPCLNRSASLEAALRSLDAQSIRRRLRVIVVDNGSTDGSREVAEHLADVAATATERGSAAARNLGLEMTETPFMLTLDADCRPAIDTWAEAHLQALSVAPESVVASAGQIVPLPSSDWWANRREITPQPAFDDNGAPLYAVGANSCYRTEGIRSLGGFPHYRADDAALGEIVREQGGQYAWTPRAVVYHANAAGPLGYVRQTYKIGYYAAELKGSPTSWSRYAAGQVRHLGSRVLRARDVREALSGVLLLGGTTAGAASCWLRDRRPAAAR